MMYKRCAVWALSTALITQAGCFKTLPPLESPAAEVPVVANPPPENPALGRVAFESTPKARVHRVEAFSTGMVTGSGGAWASGSSQTMSYICTTPCVANLPYGSYSLSFYGGVEPDGAERTDGVTVDVGKKPAVVRANLGRLKPPSTGKLILGSTVLFVAGSLALTGGIFTAISDTRSVGIPLLLGGLAGSAGGIVLTLNSRGELQHGAATQFTPNDGVIFREQ
jgi:hypothetical protein